MNNVFSQTYSPVRIAVVTSAGGSEHAVSIRSAENVCSALRSSFPVVQTFAFDTHIQSRLTAWQPDVVFPVAHGSGETGELQQLLESLDMAYVGSDVVSSVLCWNKVDANRAVAQWFTRATEWPNESGLCAVPPFVTLRQGDDIRRCIQEFSEAHSSTSLLIVKPAREGSSVGISFCVMPNHKSLTAEEAVLTINGSMAKYRLARIIERVEQAFAYDDLVILQVAVTGVEITVAVLEDPEPAALPVVEIVTPAGTWYDYEHKYSTGGSEHIIPARLRAAWLGFVQTAAVSVHCALGCRDYSRVDFIVEEGDAELMSPRLWFLECNTLPGFTATSLFPDAAMAAGYAMPELVKRLVLRAWRRHS
ncbi:hypothetical protein [Polaromonas sp.]|uniref:D-alanine--D-alanine ligase family protein n=1 Tax=Polaromonas sp. TaxID=1869339 RepID=UPI002731ADE8|nr:hypothetical protein [Polaromonas sp.]MDP1740960.1 hypothetical protein [Polaromonas sp.]